MVIGMAFGWQMQFVCHSAGLLRSYSDGLVKDLSHINNSRYVTFVANILNSFIIAKILTDFCIEILAALAPALPSAIPGSACSGCRSGAGARSSQDCHGQRQTAATPDLRLRLSLHKVRLRRPLRHLLASHNPGTSPAIRRSRSESRAGFCAMASRSARVWGGTPV